MRVLFITDPVETLKAKGDTSLMLAHSAMLRGHEVSFVEDFSVRLNSGSVTGAVQTAFDFELGDRPKLKNRVELPFESFDAIFIRKDPPFSDDYVRLCWLLLLLESKVNLVAKPSTLLLNHEKMLPLLAMQASALREDELIPTFVGDAESAKQWVQTNKIAKVISKPFLGHGGEDVQQFSISDFLKSDFDDVRMIQPYLENIHTDGDRRVFMIGGKIAGSFVRIPRTGKIVSNIAQGGTPLLRPLTEKQTEILSRLGKFLSDSGIVFAGVDLIGNQVSEVNITSPTGLWQYHQLTHENLAPKILEASSL